MPATGLQAAEDSIKRFPREVFHPLLGNTRGRCKFADSVAWTPHKMGNSAYYSRMQMHGQNCFLLAFLNSLHVLLAWDYPGVHDYVRGIERRSRDAFLFTREELAGLADMDHAVQVLKMLNKIQIQFAHTAEWANGGALTSEVDELNRHPALVNLPRGTHHADYPHNIAVLFPFVLEERTNKLVPRPLYDDVGPRARGAQAWYYCLVPAHDMNYFAMISARYFSGVEVGIAPIDEVSHAGSEVINLWSRVIPW